MDRIADEISRKLAQTYATRRNAAIDNRDRRVSAIHAAHPELAEYTREIDISGSALVLEVLDSGRPPLAGAQLKALEASRQALLAKLGIPSDYDVVKPVCSSCGDTGRVTVKTGSDPGICDCQTELRRVYLREASDLGSLASFCFANFDESLFDEHVNEKRDRADVSPRVQTQGVRNVCKKFVQSLGKSSPDSRDLLFTGMPGTGKTCMAACVANEAIDACLSVRYLPAPRMFDILGGYRALSASFRPDEDRFEEAERDYATILESRLLIIDDLGTESMKPATLPELLQILDQRHGAGLRTLFCTNAEPAALRDLYDERLWSRIIGRCTILRFFGDDLRLKAARDRRQLPRQLPQPPESQESIR